jgi:23S rRNA pseudouridine1911/1915/1917 synthase
VSPTAGPDDDRPDDDDVDVDVDPEFSAEPSAATSPSAGPVVVAVDAAGHGDRVDAFVARVVPSLSRSRVAALVDAGSIVVDGAATKPSAKLRLGQTLTVTLPPPAPTTLVPEDLPLAIVFDDDDFCVLDKRAGQVVHPGVGHASGTIANALLFRFPALSISGEQRPGIVHRLDKETSGVMVVAKNDIAMRTLADAFRQRQVQKRYVAVCLGVPASPLELVTGHARATNDRRRFTTKLPPPSDDSAKGGLRRAHSRFVVRAARDGVAVVDVDLLTGRTHQIRAHLADVGHPLLQDTLYGGGHAERRVTPGAVRDTVAQLHRCALHAASLTLPHPKTGAALTFVSPLPADLAAVVAAVEAP